MEASPKAGRCVGGGQRRPAPTFRAQSPTPTIIDESLFWPGEEGVCVSVPQIWHGWSFGYLSAGIPEAVDRIRSRLLKRKRKIHSRQTCSPGVKLSRARAGVGVTPVDAAL